MPLVGFLCEVLREPVSFEDCLACAIARHPCAFTFEMLKAMTRNAEDRADAGISVTSITGCLRKGFLSLARDYYSYPHQLWPALRGTTLHKLLEDEPEPECVYETRFSRSWRAEITGSPYLLPEDPSVLVTLTAKSDKLVPHERLLVDWKSKDKLPKSPSEDYVWQLNIYRWLVADGIVVSPGKVGLVLEQGAHVNYEIDRLGLVYLTMKEVNKYPVNLIPFEKIEAYVKPRANAVVAAMLGGLLPPAEENPTSNFCQDWCPHVQECQALGPGEE